MLAVLQNNYILDFRTDADAGYLIPVVGPGSEQHTGSHEGAGKLPPYWHCFMQQLKTIKIMMKRSCRSEVVMMNYIPDNTAIVTDTTACYN
jgi:hypothetical protein